MNARIYVGNLAFTAREQELRDLFGSFGDVVSARVVMDKMSGRSKGFGFVEMSTADAAQAAISELHGKEAFGRMLTVSEAKERPEGERSPRRDGDRPRHGGGGGFNRGGDRGGDRFDRPRRDDRPQRRDSGYSRGED